MGMKMKELPMSERPYEKLEMYGPKALSNAELLAIIIKSGTREESSVMLAQQILNLNQSKKEDSLQFMQNITIPEYMKIKGIGKVKAIQLSAVCELTKRMRRPIHQTKIKMENSQDVANYFMEEMRYESQEIAKMVLFTDRNEAYKIVDIALGATNFAAIEPRHILRQAIKYDAQRFILVHNHPNGTPNPSKEDFRITDCIVEACMDIGMELIDHIIIGKDTYRSVLYMQKMKKYWS